MSAWTGKIVSTDTSKGTFLIGVQYTNGVTTFSESLDVTGGIMADITVKIQNRVVALNNNDILLPIIQNSIQTSSIIQAPVQVASITSL